MILFPSVPLHKCSHIFLNKSSSHSISKFKTLKYHGMNNTYISQTISEESEVDHLPVALRPPSQRGGYN